MRARGSRCRTSRPRARPELESSRQPRRTSLRLAAGSAIWTARRRLAAPPAATVGAYWDYRWRKWLENMTQDPRARRSRAAAPTSRTRCAAPERSPTASRSSSRPGAPPARRSRPRREPMEQLRPPLDHRDASERHPGAVAGSDSGSSPRQTSTLGAGAHRVRPRRARVDVDARARRQRLLLGRGHPSRARYEGRAGRLEALDVFDGRRRRARCSWCCPGLRMPDRRAVHPPRRGDRVRRHPVVRAAQPVRASTPATGSCDHRLLPHARAFGGVAVARPVATSGTAFWEFPRVPLGTPADAGAAQHRLPVGPMGQARRPDLERRTASPTPSAWRTWRASTPARSRDLRGRVNL